MADFTRLSRLTRVARVRRVDVYVHWSVFLIIAVVLLGALHNPLLTLAGIAAYAGVLILHEAGHLVVARLKGYHAFSIELYPIFGTAHFERPDSRVDRALIAWGGVAAQAIVGIPLVLFTAVHGYTRFDALNACLALLGGFSVLTAALNLLPVGRLDGSVAWDIVPALIERRQTRQTRRVVPYRSPR